MTDGITLIHGDCLERMREIAPSSVDAIVTDPPAGIGFMGVAWDSYGGKSGAPRSDDEWDWTGSKERPRTSDQIGRVTAKQGRAFRAFLGPVMAECLRVAKPGARALVWAIPRTSHWTATAIEDAGWIIEERIAHIFGQGFPKAKSKLKPAVEDWWLARKPSKNVPPLNIDDCRIAAPEGLTAGGQCPPKVRNTYAQDEWTKTWEKPRSEEHPAGRWPANCVMSHSPGCVPCGMKRVKGSNFAGHPEGHKNQVYGKDLRPRPPSGYAGPDDMETVAAWSCVEGCPVAELDEQSGVLKSGGRPGGEYFYEYGQSRNVYGDGLHWSTSPLIADSGGASRFFATFGYFPKASPADRGDGNSHPTVKSLDLMAWLVKLITQPDDLVLDPFAGSGSTLVACYHTHRRAVGIEQNADYVAIARRRLKDAELPLFARRDTDTAPDAGREGGGA